MFLANGRSGAAERFIHALIGQLIGTFVEFVATVPLDPAPVDAVTLLRGIECLPQIDILDRLLVGSFPAVFLPAVNPGGDTVLHILRIGMQDDGARAGQRGKR